MESKSEKFSLVVDQINEFYKEYSLYSNDEIRCLTKQIESEFKKNLEDETVLESFLPQVYAIVKDTARRFTQGEVEVTANDWDRELAEIFDFVVIKGNKAVYKNQWYVGGNKIKWEMIHYDEQLYAGILLNKGYATEMATGEGKTLVATLPVFLNALTHKGVHLMTVNDYLSKRDCELTRPIYLFHGLTVDCIEYYSRNDKRRQNAYKSDITFGTNSEFAFDYLFDNLSVTKHDWVQRIHNFALIDELDSILIDNADEPHIIANSNSESDEALYKQYKPIIEDFAEEYSNEGYCVDKLNHKAWFTYSGKKHIEEKIGIAGLFDYTRTYQIEGFDQLTTDEQRIYIEKLRTHNVLNQLLNAYTLYVKDIHYIILDERVVILDNHTGRLKQKSRFEHGLHSALEAKENVRILRDQEVSAVISLKNYFKLYSRIGGMSGTLKSVSEELFEVYGLKTQSIPTHSPLIRNDKTTRVFKTKNAKDWAIIEEIKFCQSIGRPVLVGCLSIKRAEEISQLLTSSGLDHHLLSAKNIDEEAYYISRAGQNNIITVTTSMAGRGTDIKLSQSVKVNGGLAIIGTDLFDSSRVDKQMKGRAGRQGDPGSSVFFTSLEDEIMRNLDSEDTQQLDKLVQQVPTDEILSDGVLFYVNKAQSNREQFHYNNRVEVARKDDVIAPYRFRVYQIRSDVLFGKTDINCVINQFIPGETERILIDQNLTLLIEKSLPIVRKIKKYQSDCEAVSLPYSVNKMPFVITFDIKKLIVNPLYFKQEFKRQLILLAYDSFWIKFVQHLNSDLDKNEIDSLPEEFERLNNEICKFVLLRLQKSMIPINTKDLFIKNEELNIEHDTKTDSLSIEFIKQDDLCSCGSGKKFGECHGYNTLQRIRRSRR